MSNVIDLHGKKDDELIEAIKEMVEMGGLILIQVNEEAMDFRFTPDMSAQDVITTLDLCRPAIAEMAAEEMYDNKFAKKEMH